MVKMNASSHEFNVQKSEELPLFLMMRGEPHEVNFKLLHNSNETIDFRGCVQLEQEIAKAFSRSCSHDEIAFQVEQLAIDAKGRFEWDATKTQLFIIALSVGTIIGAIIGVVIGSG
jgi:hypothetical protein